MLLQVAPYLLCKIILRTGWPRKGGVAIEPVASLDDVRVMLLMPSIEPGVEVG